MDLEIIKKEIEEKGFEQVAEERKSKLIELFKEMLEYKKKKYDENWTFKQYIDKIAQYYNFYYNSLYWAYEAIEFGCVKYEIDEDTVDVSEEGRIQFLDDLYEELVHDENDYKFYAYAYRDFELEEGQTYSDLYKLEKEKYKDLFKEILDFLNVSYEKEREQEYDYLRITVADNYPFYEEQLYFNIKHNRLGESYISILNSMENIYDYIKSTYKDYDENMRKYEEKQAIEKKRIEEEEDDGFEFLPEIE